jgi:hypothetical protein
VDVLGACNLVIAIRKDPHSNEPAGRCRSEVPCREGSSSGICLIEDCEGKCMDGPDERIGTCRSQVAGIFVQEGTCQKLSSVSGPTICQSVSVIPAKCVGAIFPLFRIFARWIKHSRSCAKGWQDDGWWTEGFVFVYAKFILGSVKPRSSGRKYKRLGSHVTGESFAAQCRFSRC